MGRVRVARSARTHKIGNARILAALRNAGMPNVVGDRLDYVGRDDRGVDLEISAVPTDGDDDSTTVIRAMPTQWRRT